MADTPSGSATGAGQDAQIIDMETFEQLLEIDDDDSREFSKGLAQQYVEQAVATFAEMEDALSKQDLDKLSKLGHFLKGSSASIGLIAVSKSCAEMQNFGNCLDEAGSSRISSEKALENCTGLIVKLKKEQDAAKTWLEDFYKEKW